MKVKRRKRLSAALVLFGLTILPASNLRAGYAITDRQGTFFRLYVEPQEEELLAFIRGNAARYSHYLY